MLYVQLPSGSQLFQDLSEGLSAVLDQRLPLENTWQCLSPLFQVSSHKAQSNRAQSYSLYKLRMEVWSTHQRLGHIRWRGHPFREFGDAQASAAPGFQAEQLQDCVTGGCCWLVAAQSSAGQLLLWKLLPQALGWQAQRCWGLISHPAVLLCRLSFVPACGAQLISRCGSGFTDAEGDRFASFVRWALPFQS